MLEDRGVFLESEPKRRRVSRWAADFRESLDSMYWVTIAVGCQHANDHETLAVMAGMVGRLGKEGEKNGRSERALTDSDCILDTSRNNDVSHLGLRLDVDLKVWLDEGEPLLDASLDITTAFLDVAKNWMEG